MKYGICTGIGAKDKWGVGHEHIAMAASAGFDYVELPLAAVMRMPEDVFAQEVLGTLAAHRMSWLTCNVFFPATVRLCGPDADEAQIADYAEQSIARAAQGGVKAIVLGSAGSRNLPIGMPLREGYAQLAHALGTIATIARRHGISIAIEPLNRAESNVVNRYVEGLYLAALTGQPNVGALVDSHHFFLNGENTAELLIATPMHAHYANALGRRLPTQPDEAGREFFAALRASGYDGGVSLEGNVAGHLADEAAQALEALRAM